MNVLLLSVPRSGTSYVADVITNSLNFKHVFLDPIDSWHYNADIIKKQNIKLIQVRNALLSGSVFVRHNSHFSWLDTELKNEFEKLFQNFYIIKLIRTESLFEFTLSICYNILTNISHDFLYKKILKIEIPEELYLEQREVCKIRQHGLREFKVYNEILNYESVLNKEDTLSGIKLDWSSSEMKKNTSNQSKITNYNKLYEKYKNDTEYKI